MRAAAELGTTIPKLCATDSLEAFGSCRLCLVEIEGRNGYPASCTTPVEHGHEGPHPVAQAGGPAARRDGALHLRSPARLPHLSGQRRLRAAGHGRRGRPARGPLRLRRRRTTSIRQRKTLPTPTSRSIRASASSAPAACAPARRSRAPSRSRSTDAGSIRWSPPGRTDRSWSPSASPAAPASRRARRPR